MAGAAVGGGCRRGRADLGHQGGRKVGPRVSIPSVSPRGQRRRRRCGWGQGGSGRGRWVGAGILRRFRGGRSSHPSIEHLCVCSRPSRQGSRSRRSGGGSGSGQAPLQPAPRSRPGQHSRRGLVNTVAAPPPVRTGGPPGPGPVVRGFRRQRSGRRGRLGYRQSRPAPMNEEQAAGSSDPRPESEREI